MGLRLPSCSEKGEGKSRGILSLKQRGHLSGTTPSVPPSSLPFHPNIISSHHTGSRGKIGVAMLDYDCTKFAKRCNVKPEDESRNSTQQLEKKELMPRVTGA